MLTSPLRTIVGALVVCSHLLLIGLSPALGQNNGQPGGGGGQPGGGGGQPGQGNNDQAAGISIDTRGIISPVVSKQRANQLVRHWKQTIAAEDFSDNIDQPSEMRKVSLVRLEAAYEKLLEGQEPLPIEMRYLAGLQRIDYVFVYPETNDVVIAGPAEGFGPDGLGRLVGTSTGRPPLQLNDLMVALRAIEEEGRLGCSIDPTSENLAALQRFLARNSTPASVAVVQRRYQQMAQILGMQEVTIWGVPTGSRFAQVLVEADFRMKRIAMGLDNPKVRGLKSHLSMITPEGNSMQRWWFTPLYEAFYTTEDRRAFELAGQRLQLMSQDEYVDGAGRRSDAPFTRVTTERFAQQFTEKFPELAEREPVFAELQNLVDLAIVAALLKEQQIPEQIDWPMALFLDSERAVVPEGVTPTHVPSEVNFRRAGRGTILGLVGGGVTVRPSRTVRSISFEVDPAKRLDGIHELAAQASESETDRWWWD